MVITTPADSPDDHSFQKILLVYVLYASVYHQINKNSLHFFVFRHGFCSYTEGSFNVKAGSHIGNRIQSITERTAIIEGKNKV